MTDKFDKLSIYDIEHKIKDDDGVEHTFNFKPLPFSDYAKGFDVFSKMSDLEGLEGKDIIKKLDKDTINSLIALEKTMVSNSYKDLDDNKVEVFVMSNVFELIDPLSQVIFKQTKLNPRQAQKVAKD